MVDTVLVDLAARVLNEAAKDPVGGFDWPLWAKIETCGIDRLLMPEEHGGAGDVFAEAVALMIVFGGSGAAIPLADTLVANWCLSKAGLDVPQGPKAFLAEPDLKYDGVGWSGVAYWLPAVPTGILVTEFGDDTLVGVIDRVSGRAGESACGEPLLWIERNAPLPPRVGQAASVFPGQPLALAATLEAAMIVGALEKVCALSIEYANTRKQFGRPIAKFQAVQILVARLASEAAAARAAVEHAANELVSSGALFWAGVAKARASEAAGKAAAYAHQIHGAIGFTREYDLHRHTRRLWTWRERRGNERYWNTKIGSATLQHGGKKLWSGLVDGSLL